MNAEQEALLQSYDAWLNALPEDADRFYHLFDSRLDDVASRSPVSKETLVKLIRMKYPRWLFANRKLPSV